jgi:Domain of unknown function (DUF4214)/Abnormal spindle-like microcephaly-assoc'd, ASPM-SPD-2-Hydin
MIRFVSCLFKGLLLVLSLGLSSMTFALPFNSEFRVTGLNGHGLTPHLAASGGNLHLVWVEYTNGNQPGVVQYSRSTDNGSSWSAPRAISPPGVDTYWPVVAANGATVNVFYNTNPNEGRVFQLRSTDTGSTFSGAIQVSNNGAGSYARAARALADGNGRVHLIWYDSRFSPLVGRLVYRLSCNGGQTFGAEVNLSAQEGEVDDESPELALSSDGTVMALFRSTREGRPQGGYPPFMQYMLRSNTVNCAAVTTTWRFPAQRISPPAYESLSPTYSGYLAAGAQGRMHVAYWDTTGGANVMFLRGNPSAGGLSRATNVSGLPFSHGEHFGVTTEVSRPAITEDANGRVHLFFTPNDQVSNGTYQTGRLLYRESLDQGATFAAAQQLGSTTAMTPMAVTHNGRVHLVWSDFRDLALGPKVYHRFANADGSVSNNPVASFNPATNVFVGNVALGQTGGSATITLTNTGSANLVVSSVVGTAEFPSSSNCGTLAPNATCTITVRHTPAAAGVRTGTVTVTTNASGSPHVISVNGVGESASADTDGDGIPNDVEVQTGRNPQVKDNDIFANASLFVQQQYRDFLGREGDSGGVNFWAGEINAARVTRAQMAENYFTSAEFQSINAPIVRLYLGTYLRIPDTSGLLFWIGEYRRNPTRATLESIATQFATAPEFVQRYGAVSNQTYVTLLYQNILQRQPDAAGVSFWTDRLDRGVTRGVMLAEFTESAEYAARAFNQTYVISIYVGMLRRAPDQAGFDFWVGRLNQGQSGLQLIDGFIGAGEYRNRFLP